MNARREVRIQVEGIVRQSVKKVRHKSWYLLYGSSLYVFLAGLYYIALVRLCRFVSFPCFGIMQQCVGCSSVPGRVKLFEQPGKIHLCLRTPWAGQNC